MVNFVGTLGLPSAAAVRRNALADPSEYAKNLLATKDRATVVEVLVRATGASVQELEDFVSRIEAS